MPGPKLGKDFGVDSPAVFLNVHLPTGLLDRTLVLGANIEQGQVRLATEGLALKNGGEDCTTIRGSDHRRWRLIFDGWHRRLQLGRC